MCFNTHFKRPRGWKMSPVSILRNTINSWVKVYPSLNSRWKWFCPTTYRILFEAPWMCSIDSFFLRRSQMDDYLKKGFLAYAINFWPCVMEGKGFGQSLNSAIKMGVESFICLENVSIQNILHMILVQSLRVDQIVLCLWATLIKDIRGLYYKTLTVP